MEKLDSRLSQWMNCAVYQLFQFLIFLSSYILHTNNIKTKASTKVKNLYSNLAQYRER